MTLLSLTTRERVRRMTGDKDPTIADANKDTLIDQGILAVSQSFEDYLAIPMFQEARTEEYSVSGPWRDRILLRSWFGSKMPTPTITSVKVRTSWETDWADVTALDSTEYTLSSDPTGYLLYRGTFHAGTDTVQVVYTSGFATSTANLIANFPQIAELADRQVVHEYLRRREGDKGSIDIQGAGQMYQEPLRLLDIVKQGLAPYRKITVG